MKRVFWIFRELLFDNTCKLCGNKSETLPCLQCRREIKYQSSIKNEKNLYYMWNYSSKIKEMIRVYKFLGLKEFGGFIGEIVEMRLRFVLKKEEIDAVIPVPSSRGRIVQRGFNQNSVILDIANIPYLELKRKKEKKHMALVLKESARRINIKDNFEVPDGLELNGKNVLIFDDVITTGSTSSEISRVLYEKYKINKIIIFSMAAANYYFIKNRKRRI